jgi:hypothetical protein
MAAPSPATDPLWAYDTPGWTNQGNTGDTIGTQLTGAPFSANAFLGEPEALSGYIARSIDPALNSVSGTTGTAISANTTGYFAALEVMNPALTKKIVVSTKYTTSADTLSMALYNFAGVQVATITGVAQTTSFAPVIGTWSTAATLGPGTYYVGLCASSTHTTLQTTTLTVEQSLLAQATTFAANVLNWRFFTATITANTLPTTLSGTIVGGTVGWFAGLG